MILSHVVASTPPLELCRWRRTLQLMHGVVLKSVRWSIFRAAVTPRFLAPLILVLAARLKDRNPLGGQMLVDADASSAHRLLDVIREFELPIVLLFNSSRVVALAHRESARPPASKPHWTSCARSRAIQWRSEMQRTITSCCASQRSVSTRALGWAADLAQEITSPLLLVHVVEPIAVAPQWQSYIEEADEARVAERPLVWTKWAAADLQPFAAWSHGRITLTGDAAHATLPLAQGAAMALEDAAVLARTLRRNGIADGFELYSQLHRPVPAGLRLPPRGGTALPSQWTGTPRAQRAPQGQFAGSLPQSAGMDLWI